MSSVATSIRHRARCFHRWLLVPKFHFLATCKLCCYPQVVMYHLKFKILFSRFAFWVKKKKKREVRELAGQCTNWSMAWHNYSVHLHSDKPRCFRQSEPASYRNFIIICFFMSDFYPSGQCVRTIATYPNDFCMTNTCSMVLNTRQQEPVRIVERAKKQIDIQINLVIDFPVDGFIKWYNCSH